MGTEDTDDDGGFNLSVEQLETEQQALVLLQRLQDLKVWQSRQEERLLEEQRNQIISLQNLGAAGFQQHGGHNFFQHQMVDNKMRDDDDTTVSSIVYDEELSTLSEVVEESDSTWAERNNERPQTKELNLSNNSIMTMSEEGHANHQEEEDGTPHLEDEIQDLEDEFRDLSTPPNPEDQPVGGGGRTFEQLISDQLGSTGYLPSNQDQVPNDEKKAVEKKPFLKRGSGLTRFNLPPDPTQQPSRIKRSKSQPRFSDNPDLRNPSRLSQETLSFASKKASPHRIHASKSLNKLDDPGLMANKTASSRKSSPPVRLKLKSPAKKKENSAPPSKGGLQRGGDPRESVPRPRELTSNVAKHVIDPKLQDSVENSFREKLSAQEARHEKELKELAVFEMLEDAANDSSFCSNSSRVKTLMNNSMLPSPTRAVANARPTNSTSSSKYPSPFHSKPPSPVHKGSSRHPPSSTPINNNSSARRQEDDDTEDPSLGESLMEDIRRFVMQGHVTSGMDDHRKLKDMRPVPQFDEVDEEDEDEDEDEDDDDSTVCEEEDRNDDESIGKDWRARIAEWDKENVLEKDEKKERNMKNDKNIIEISPPEKVPKNSPSYLIWSIFTREREEKKLRALQKKQLSGEGNVEPRSAPPRLIADNASHSKQPASPLSLANNLQSNDDLSYLSTLLQMRVVELEQEIDTFKKENTQLVSLKKKIGEEKQRLVKEWEEFEKLRDEGKKKLDEERKRIRRDKILLEKAQREHTNAAKVVCNECEENRSKISRMQEDLSSKENKWTAALSKLQEQVSKMEKENKTLHSENQRLRIKTVSSKISSTNPTTRKGSKVDARVVSDNTPGSDMTPDSGIRSVQASSGSSSGLESEEEYLDNELRKSISSTVYAALCGDTPRMSYSPAESLDSSMTLVSAFGANSTTITGGGGRSEAPQVVNNSERGTREKRYPDGRLEIWYSNGNRKEVSADGKTVKVFYYNGDLKESHSSGLVKYLYSQTQTWHITHPDSREVLQFSNGQEEVRYPDGSMEISFPDGSVKKILVDGSEDIRFPDGTRVEVNPEGDRVLHLPNGQREEHTKDMKKRVYPDGTVKILYGDGRQETRYSNGRIRIKDAEGKLIKDTHS